MGIRPRQDKGSQLTTVELDDAFEGLDDGKAPLSHSHAQADVTGLVAALAAKQAQLSGTGFVWMNGTTVTYDNSTYLTTSVAASTYAPKVSPIFSTGATFSFLTSGRVPYASTGGALVDDADLTFDGTTLSAAKLKGTGLTATRVCFVTTGGEITDGANLVYGSAQFWIKDTTVSTGTTSGAFRCDGGGAFGGNIYSGGIIRGKGLYTDITPDGLGNGSGSITIVQYQSYTERTASISGTTDGGILFSPHSNNPTVEMYNNAAVSTWNAVAHKARLNKTGGWYAAGRLGWYCSDIDTTYPSADIMFFAVGGPLQGENTALRMSISGKGGYTTIGKSMWTWLGASHPHKFTIVSDTQDFGLVATSGTTTLTGTGTRFTKLFQVGDNITVSGETVRVISAIASDTSLTVTSAFSNTASSLNFTKDLRVAFFVDDNGNIEYTNTSTMRTTNNATWVHGQVSELVTIAAAAATDSTIDLPADAVIESVVGRVTVAIPGAATFTVGDATTAGRFATAVPTSVGGFVGILHWSGAVATLAAGPSQAATAKVRFTPNAVPSGATGRVRITIFYRKFVAPTS